MPRYSALLLIFCLAASPTTQLSRFTATTEKATVAAEVADREKTECLNKLNQAKANCLSRLHQTSSQFDSDKKLADASVALEKARKSGTSQERLDASTAFNRLRMAVDAAEKKAINSDKLIVALSAELKEKSATSIQAQQSLSQSRSDLERERQYVVEHADFIEASSKIDSSLKSAEETAERCTGYERYLARTTALVNALQTIDTLDTTKTSDDDYAAVVKKVSEKIDAWSKSLTETEAIYSSADAIKAAIRSYSESLSWRRFERDWSKKADDSIKDNNPDVAQAQLNAAGNFLRKQVAALDNARSKTEAARRAMLTRENTVPAVPSPSR